jgi:hypothetical protein
VELLSISNQQLQNRPVAFGIAGEGVLEKRAGRGRSGIRSVVAGESLGVGSYIASLALKLVGKDVEKYGEVLKSFPRSGQDADVLQIGVKGTDSDLNNPHTVFINHIAAFRDGQLSQPFAKVLENIKRLLKIIENASHIDRPVTGSSEGKKMRAVLSDGANFTFESREFADETSKVQRIAHILKSVVDRIKHPVDQ